MNKIIYAPCCISWDIGICDIMSEIYMIPSHVGTMYRTTVERDCHIIIDLTFLFFFIHLYFQINLIPLGFSVMAIISVRADVDKEQVVELHPSLCQKFPVNTTT